MTKTFEKSCETRTCTYEPESLHICWDEDDNEVADDMVKKYALVHDANERRGRYADE